MQSKPDDIVTLRGRVAKVYYASPTYSAGVLEISKKTKVTFAGNLFVREDDHVVLMGEWITHPKYGDQLKVESMHWDLDLDSNGLAHYLANHPKLKGIGPVKARIIAGKFGKDFEMAINCQPEAVAKAAGIPLQTVKDMQEIWEETRAVNEGIVRLSAYGLTFNQVKALVDKFGNSVLGLLQEDPYLIVREVPGFGFKRVDGIARKIGTAKDHPSRIRAGLVFCVDEALENGDCWVEFRELLSQANSLLFLDMLDSLEVIERHLDGLVSEGSLVCKCMIGQFLIARPWMKDMEFDLAKWFRGAWNPNPFATSFGDVASLVSHSGFQLNEGQTEAVRSALRHSISVISGSAGSGKTYCVSAITKIYQEHGLHVALVAPTGKAAKRLEQVVNHSASTIHKLLRYDGQTYGLGPEETIEAAVVVVDEMSMVDSQLAWHLFRAIDLNRTAVVLVGDHNQLPPIRPGNVLKDLFDSKSVPTVILDKVVRQAGVLKENCMAVLKGEVRPTSGADSLGKVPWYVSENFVEPMKAKDFILGIYERGLSERLGFDLLRDVQFLTPTHKGPLGTAEFNKALQRLIQKKLWGVDVPNLGEKRRPPILLNDKVIQTRNNYALGIMNGAIGYVVNVSQDGDLTIEFDGELREIEAGSEDLNDLRLAYSLSFHKTQGSEYPCAVVLVHRSHGFMHHRNLLYTGVSRAQQMVILVGDHWGIQNCAKIQKQDDRKTFLKFLLTNEDGDECRRSEIPEMALEMLQENECQLAGVGSTV